MFTVVVQVTALAHSLEVFVSAVLGRVVEVGDSQHDERIRPVRSAAVDVRTAALMRAPAALALALAAALRTLEANPTADL